MAHAPTPGVSSRAESASAVKRVVCVRLVETDETFRLAASNVPLDQRAVVLKQVGISYDTLMSSGDGQLMTAVVAWLARRMGGERSLSWVQFQRQWPEALTDEDFDVWAEDTQGRRLDDDGEPIVPADEDEAAEDAVGGDDPQS